MNLWKATFAILGLWILGAGSASAQATLRGTVYDVEGKPFPGVKVIIRSNDTGAVHEVTTDAKGEYLLAGLRGGNYTLVFRVKEQDLLTQPIRIPGSGEFKFDANFKELLAAELENIKRQEAEREKFETMKAAFDAGTVTLEQAKQLRNRAATAPSAERGELQSQLNQLAQSAISSFEQARQAAGETDRNLHLIYAKLGESYEVAGRYEEAIAAYQKAVELRPTESSYYNNLGNTLAKAGKIDEARLAYQKSAELNPTRAAEAWMNLGIVLWQNYRYEEAIEPLQKSLELNPQNAQAWYVLGASLVGLMQFKQEGDKNIPILRPGTVEAYQKCIEVDPNGPFAAQARQALAELEAIGVGISTRVNVKKKKG